MASRARLVFHAAFGEAEKKPRGRPRKTPLALPKPGNVLTADAEESRQFLKTILPEGKRQDDRNAREVQQARHGLALMSHRLEDLERNPSQNPNDRRQPSYVDLDRLDPSQEEVARRREEAYERLQDSVMAIAERNLTEALKSADETYEPKPVASVSVPNAEEPQAPLQPTAADAPRPQAEPASAAPATGVGSRPAYLDEKNPKGTRYRYEPFSIRPDRPQKGSSPAASSPARSETQAAPKRPAETVSAPPSKPAQTPAPTAVPTKSPAPATLGQVSLKVPNVAPKASAPTVTGTAKPSEASTPDKQALSAPAQRAATPPATSRPVELKPNTVETKPASPAASGGERELAHQQAKPDPKGSFTLTQMPTRTTPSPVHGLVVEGAKPKPQAYGRDLAPTPSGYPTDKGPVSPANPIAVEPERQSPVTALPAPMKPALKRGKKKRLDRNDRGPDR